MSRVLTATLFVLGLLALPASAQDVYWADPVHGLDVVQRSGSPQQPFRTLSFAVSRQVPGRSLTVMLEPGDYPDETWPIPVGPDDLTVESPITGAAYLHGAGPSFYNFTLTPDSGALSLEGFTLAGSQDIVRVDGDGLPGDRVDVTLDRISAIGSNLVHAIIGGELELSVTVNRSWWRGANTGMLLRLWDDSSASVVIKRTRFVRSGFGIDARTLGPNAAISMELENSVITGSLVNAVRLQGGGGPADLSIVHCDLVSNGTGTGTPFPAVQLIPPFAGAATPTAEIRHSIIWDNASAIADYASMAANYTFETNVVQDPGLAGLGGNLDQDPQWAGSTRLLLPASPGRAAAAPGTIYDFLGHPRGTSATDIGAFEHTLFTLGMAGGSWVGSSQEIAVAGPPYRAFAVFAGTALGTGPGGLDILPMPGVGAPLFQGQLDADGLGTHTVIWPSNPGFAGRRFFFQVAGRDAAGAVQFGYVVPVVASLQPTP